MKYIFKTNFLQIILSFILIISFMIILHPLDTCNLSKETLSINSEKNPSISLDIDGNGTNDTVYIKDNNIYIKIDNSNICLNDCLNKPNFISSKSWPIKVYFKKIARKPSYDIIIESQIKDKQKNNISVLTYSNNTFNEIYNSNDNIFGILDINTGKTPECFSIESQIGTASKKSFMIINDKAKDISKNCYSLPDISEMLKFIDIIETNYEVDETADIFSASIDSEELGIVWNLDKEHNHYSFQNAYFENNSYDSKGNLKSINWTLSFEKYTINKDDSNKEELILHVTTSKEDDKFKISSIEKQSDSENNLLNY